MICYPNRLPTDVSHDEEDSDEEDYDHDEDISEERKQITKILQVIIVTLLFIHKIYRKVYDWVGHNPKCDSRIN